MVRRRSDSNSPPQKERKEFSLKTFEAEKILRMGEVLGVLKRKAERFFVTKEFHEYLLLACETLKRNVDVNVKSLLSPTCTLEEQVALKVSQIALETFLEARTLSLKRRPYLLLQYTIFLILLPVNEKRCAK